MDLFKIIINNKLLKNIIFENVKILNRKCTKVFIEYYSWNQLKELPLHLISYNYLDQLKLYFNSINNNNDSNSNMMKPSYLDYDDDYISNYDSNQFIIQAIKFNRLNILKYLLDELHLTFDPTQYDEDSNNSHWISSNGHPNKDLLFYASKYGKLDIVIYLNSRNDSSSNNNNDDDDVEFNTKKYNYGDAFGIAPTSSCNSQQLNELMTWLFHRMNLNELQLYGRYDIDHEKPLNPLVIAAENCALFGRAEMFDWTMQLYMRYCDPKILYIFNMTYNAMYGGHTSILYIVKKNHYQYPIMDYTVKQTQNILLMNYAAEFGNLEVLRWLHQYERQEEGFRLCSSGAMDKAAENGHLEVVKFLHQRKEGCSNYCLPQAAKNGNVEVVKWLHQNRTEQVWNPKMTFLFSIKSGNIEIIQYLHDQRVFGNPINADMSVFYMTIENNYTKVLEWLLQFVFQSDAHNIDDLIHYSSNCNRPQSTLILQQFKLKISNYLNI